MAVYKKWAKYILWPSDAVAVVQFCLDILGYCTQKTARKTLNTTHYTLQMAMSSHWTLYTAHWKLHRVHSAHCILHTAHGNEFTLTFDSVNGT